MRYLFVILALIGIMFGCAGNRTQRPSPKLSPGTQAVTFTTPIQHVVIIFQENRTPDQLLSDGACTSADANFFMTYTPAPAATPYLPGCISNYSFAGYGIVNNQQVALQALDLCSQTPCHCHGQSFSSPYAQCANPQNYDPRHQHIAFQKQYNNGKMNGWNNVQIDGSGCQIVYCTMTYTPVLQVEPLISMIVKYTTNDNFFQDNQGPSFVAHQYIISGSAVCGTLCTTTKNVGGACCLNKTPPPTVPQYAKYEAIDNPDNANGGGCDAPSTGLVDMIDPFAAQYPDLLFPCFDRNTILDTTLAVGGTVKYYQSGGGAGLWNGPNAVWHLWNNSNFTSWVDTNVQTDFFTDVCTTHVLPTLTWVTPSGLASDHASKTDGSGPDWVSAVVNALGGGTVTPPGGGGPYTCDGRFWNTTAIFVTWDDWGGWFDHVAPSIYNVNAKGFRVPFINISPYTKANNVDHTFTSWGSILKFTDEAFSLASLGTTDVSANDLMQEFNFTGTPRPFVPIVFRAGPGAKVKPTPDKVPIDY
jgi:phospholipase C